MPIRLLHVSDLHLVPDRYDQQIVLKSLRSDLARFSEEEKPDVVVFSGDLNQAGGDVAQFQKSVEIFCEHVLQPLELDRDHLVICPGNHDVDRELVRREKWVEEGLLSTLRSRDTINQFIDQYRNLDVRADEIPPPFSRLKGFYQGVWAELASPGEALSPFYFIQKRMIGDIRIGFCSFNSAWRCTGEADSIDRANLVLGERVIDLAVDDIADCELKVAVFHHPTDWLVDEDRTAVEPRLHLEFDVLMYGHVHQAMPQYRYGGAGGAVFSQGSCLYQNRKYFNGYSAIDFDLARSNVKFSVFEYRDASRQFVAALGLFPPSGCVSFDVSAEAGDEASSLNRLIALSRPSIRRMGNEHVSLAVQDAAKVDIERHFICPPIKASSHNPAYLESDKPAKDAVTTVDEQLAIASDLLLLGSPEGGKTSIAHYCAIKSTTGSADRSRLPLIGSFREMRKGATPLWRAVRAYANEVSDGKIDRTAVENLPTLIIIDDVDLTDTSRLEVLGDIRRKHPSARFILLALETPGNGQVLREQSEHLQNFEIFAVQELPRNSIRMLSATWLNAEMESHSTDDMFEKVMDHIQRSGFPRSGYIVSLILWTLRNRSAGEILNEAVLLQNIIDHLLGKMDYTGALRKEFDFTSKTAVLQDLAAWFKEGDEIRSKNDVLNRIINFLSQKGLSYDAASVLEGFITCGVLQQVDEEVSFRYRRFQEFFVAGHLRDQRENLDRLIEGEDWLYYARELDIYTSRFRHEASLLNVAKAKMEKESVSRPKLSREELEAYLAEGGVAELAVKRLQKMRQEPMSAKRIDEMKDRAEASLERRSARLGTTAATDASSAGKGPRAFRHFSALVLYSQFIRNLEFADRTEKRDHLRASLLNWQDGMRLTLEGAKEMFAELGHDLTEAAENEAEDTFREILKYFESAAKSLIPTFFSEQVYQALGSEKLADLLDEIADDEQEETLLRILSIFTLLEIDPGRAISRFQSTSWERVLEVRWVGYMVEARLYQYYQGRFLSGAVKRAFERMVAELEQRLSGGGKQRKGRVIQGMAKRSLSNKEDD